MLIEDNYGMKTPKYKWNATNRQIVRRQFFLNDKEQYNSVYQHLNYTANNKFQDLTIINLKQSENG